MFFAEDIIFIVKLKDYNKNISKSLKGFFPLHHKLTK